jgi:hypothetical protein
MKINQKLEQFWVFTSFFDSLCVDVEYLQVANSSIFPNELIKNQIYWRKIEEFGTWFMSATFFYVQFIVQII